MKKSLWILLSLVLVFGFLTGCNKESSEEPKGDIKTRICENTYSTSILGYDVSGKLDQNGTGSVNVNGKQYDFKYTLTDLEGDSAKITINDTGVKEVDGKSADIRLEGNDLVVTYGGMSYTVKADSDKN